MCLKLQLKFSCCSLNRQVTFIGRNADQVDYTICSDNLMHNLYISRVHARIVQCDQGYRIHDDSRNGVFVNNVKIAGKHMTMLLHAVCFRNCVNDSKL